VDRNREIVDRHDVILSLSKDGRAVIALGGRKFG